MVKLLPEQTALMRMLPSSLSSFVSSHETIPAPEHEAEYPYSEFYWKPVACALLSGRVRARQQDQQPNRTEMERFCKQANFNQRYFDGVAQFHVASGVIKARFDKYEQGPHFDDFWSGDLDRLQSTARDGIVALIRKFTPFQAWRPTLSFDDVVDFLKAFFTAFEGKGLLCDKIGGAWLRFTQLPEKELKMWLRTPGLNLTTLSACNWIQWLDVKGQSALTNTLYAAGWAYSMEKDKREWFCLSSLGKVMLNLAVAPPRPPVVMEFKVVSDFTVLAGADLPVATLIPIFRYCRLKGMDNVLTFKLDKQSMRDLPSSTTAEQELLGALRPCEPLPLTVTQFLGGDPATGGVMHFKYCRGLVRVKDPAVLAALRSHPKLKGYIDRGGPPGYLIIKDASDPNNFVLRCREHGFEVKGF